ncbi:trk system potassium uptake protein TrkH [Desulfotomaculum arcticum]|uniref:Trk system potassium uptake protein TrkH n=1 Tax=Desulfotruncus arcticus DSM 17038 TaxID=1121424 RepID=A0A1I2U631_9FIRM|nr:TrkH family potassium uptake protein [Desulfotruncus arcticus]SFG72463.1 trk system potassium uptake protein TrkH [Desulfotomaculum arcticum] [Desulfotruncus arcticus DSM 17038]
MLKLNRLSPQQLLVLGFLAAIITGSVLLSTPWAVADGNIDVSAAVFTATSAVCVTGLVVVDTGTHWTFFGQLVILLLIQVGGLGIMSFATFFALLLGKRIQIRQRLIMQQALGKSSIEGIVNIFRYLLIFSFCIELAGAFILALHWLPAMGFPRALWFGLFHSVSAFNNAGFDIFGNFSSLTAFTADTVVNLVISSLFIIGGIGFVVIYEIYKYKQNKRFSLHSRVVLITTAGLIIAGTLIIFVSEYNHAFRQMTLEGKFLASFFQAVTPRTAGFNTVDLNSLLLSTQLLIISLMFVGGSSGSTAGGIKTSTFAVLGLAIYSILKGKRDTEVLGRRIAHQEVARALAIALLGLFLIFVVTFLVALTHQADFIKVLFEVVSALGTVGLSLGLTTELNQLGRILIIVTMFFGRLGPLTIGYALAYRQRQPEVRYPEGKIMLG